MRRLIVFARAPRLGAVKTRIAAAAGDARALAIHRELLETTLERLGRGGRFARELCVGDAGEGDRQGRRDGNRVRHHDADAGAGGECERLAERYGFELTLQPAGDLGERMSSVLSACLGAGGLPVLVGSDCPALSPDDVEEAFHALHTHDAVLAPADDGGYALVGARRPLPTMFECIDWGTARVLAQTRERLAELGATWHELRAVADIDTWDDYRRWRVAATRRT